MRAEPLHAGGRRIAHRRAPQQPLRSDGGRQPWFRGGIVAYCRPVKEQLLGVGESPVVSELTVRAMASNVTTSLGVAVTGVGGPEDEDGLPAGTVWNVHSPDGTSARVHRFQGSPEAVSEQTCRSAVQLLIGVIAPPASSPAHPMAPRWPRAGTPSRCGPQGCRPICLAAPRVRAPR
jgi:nicotinamide-nucleotide amidase